MVRLVVHTVLVILTCFFLITLLAKAYKIICTTSFITSQVVSVIFIIYMKDASVENVHLLSNGYGNILCKYSLNNFIL